MTSRTTFDIFPSHFGVHVGYLSDCCNSSCKHIESKDWDYLRHTRIRSCIGSCLIKSIFRNASPPQFITLERKECVSFCFPMFEHVPSSPLWKALDTTTLTCTHTCPGRTGYGLGGPRASPSRFCSRVPSWPKQPSWAISSQTAARRLPTS